MMHHHKFGKRLVALCRAALVLLLVLPALAMILPAQADAPIHPMAQSHAMPMSGPVALAGGIGEHSPQSSSHVRSKICATGHSAYCYCLSLAVSPRPEVRFKPEPFADSTIVILIGAVSSPLRRPPI
ncbi:hypothetical protein [Devosia sp.]|uniref:hypothetical protein n=1 Tax=Devosia sp. TaxID=1871048 RepID=UPI003267F907